MKQTLLVLLAGIVLSCSQKSKQSEQHEYHNQDESVTSSTEDSFDFYSDSILTSIDAEELCEFNFDFFLPQLNQKLNNHGLKLIVETASDSGSSFEIIINDHKIKLYNDNELSNGTFWDTGPRNFFRKINKILTENEINKKFYLLYGGNDLFAIFLTEEQFQTMSIINENDENEIPYSP